MPFHKSLLTSTPPLAIGPDAPMIEACNAFSSIQICLQGEMSADERKALNEMQDAIFDRMLRFRARTAEGYTARTRALAIFQDEELEEEGRWPSALLSVLLRDMLSLPNDNADMIACVQDDETIRIGGSLAGAP